MALFSNFIFQWSHIYVCVRARIHIICIYINNFLPSFSSQIICINRGENSRSQFSFEYYFKTVLNEHFSFWMKIEFNCRQLLSSIHLLPLKLNLYPFFLFFFFNKNFLSLIKLILLLKVDYSTTMSSLPKLISLRF